eukprot:11046217-Alexandrium_andersonii.AAC.1
MSASLVGSEMCIRDSFLHLCTSDRTLALQHASDLYSLAPCELGRSFSPVSYTHLTLPTICSV